MSGTSRIPGLIDDRRLVNIDPCRAADQVGRDVLWTTCTIREHYRENTKQHGAADAHETAHAQQERCKYVVALCGTNGHDSQKQP